MRCMVWLPDVVALWTPSIKVEIRPEVLRAQPYGRCGEIRMPGRRRGPNVVGETERHPDKRQRPGNFPQSQALQGLGLVTSSALRSHHGRAEMPARLSV